MSESTPQGGDSDDAMLFARDLLLSRQALSGSREAQHQYAHRMRCVPRYLAVMNSRMGKRLSEHDLEDLAQDVLQRLWGKLSTYLGHASLETWAYRCSHREMLRRLGTRRGLVTLPHEDWRIQPRDKELEKHDEIYHSLERLCPEDRVVVELKHFEELTFEEAGARLGISPNTAKTRYYRALERLRTLLAPCRPGGTR